MSELADAEVLPRGKVLITGATGFLGGSLLSRLLAGGVPVRALVRSPAKAKQLADRGVQPIIGEITDPGAVKRAVDNVAVIFHLAGKLLEPGQPDDEYRRTHILGTQLLLECCYSQSRLERFVHCSTTGVLGATGDRRPDETTVFRPTNIYEATKAEAEVTVRETWRDGFPAVIARPGLVYGPGDLHLVSFFRSVLRRQFRPIGRWPVWLHPIYIEDMTEAFIRCSELPSAVGECFNLAGPEPVSLEQLAAAIAEAGGTTLPRGRIPLIAARAIAAAGDSLPARLKASAPLTRSRLDFLTHSRTYAVSKAADVLDFVAPTELSTGMARTVSWYREHGYLPAGAAA